MSNPWNLTDRQERAMSLLAACGSRKVVFDTMGIGEAALSCLVRRACERMGAQTDLQAVLMWDRWERDGVGYVDGMPPLPQKERAQVNETLLRNLTKATGVRP